MPAKEGFAGHASHQVEVDTAGRIAAHETDERQASHSFVHKHWIFQRTDVFRTLSSTGEEKRKRCPSPVDDVDD